MCISAHKQLHWVYLQTGVTDTKLFGLSFFTFAVSLRLAVFPQYDLFWVLKSWKFSFAIALGLSSWWFLRKWQ